MTYPHEDPAGEVTEHGCGACKYQGWRGFDMVCRHPGHLEDVTRALWAAGCPDRLDWPGIGRGAMPVKGAGNAG